MMNTAQKGLSSRESLLKSYNRRLKDDIKSILDNFNEIVKTAKIEEETQVARLTEAVQTQYEIEVRASNIVRSGESLLKLVSDMKEFLILNDFTPVNASISDITQRLKNIEEETDKRISGIKDSMANDLSEMEKEYSMSDNRKMKQRIEEGEPPNAASTPSKPVITPRSSTYTRTHGKLYRENKWEKRRVSTASLYSSKESMESDITIPRSSPTSDFSSPALTPADIPSISTKFIGHASKEDRLQDQLNKNNEIRRLETKINEMALAFKEQARQKDKLEEALQNVRQEISQKTEATGRKYQTKLNSVEEEYEKQLQLKEQEFRELVMKKDGEIARQRRELDLENSRHVDVKDLTKLQQEEIGKMKSMLIHSQTEMSKKAAELMEKSKHLESLDREYAEQKSALEDMQSRLDDLAKERSKQEMREKQFEMQVTNLQKEKSALKSQLDETIAELSDKNGRLSSAELSSSRANEELVSLRQTYNLYKSRASEDLEKRNTEIDMLKERLQDLDNRLEDSTLSATDQVKALEKERKTIENRLQEARSQLADQRSQSNEKVATLGSLISTLDEQLKEKEKELQDHKENADRQISNLQNKLKIQEEKLEKLEYSQEKERISETSKVLTLQEKVADLERQLKSVKEERSELEISSDRAGFLEAQNKLLESRLKETSRKLEEERAKSEEKIRDLQSEIRKISYRFEHSNRINTETLETRVEEQERRIRHYQEKIEQVLEEKDQVQAELSLKESEYQNVSVYLEDALRKTTELKNQISSLEEAMRQKDCLISNIKDGEFKDNDEHLGNSLGMDSIYQNEIKEMRVNLENREQALLEREREISELRKMIKERDENLDVCQERIKDFEENNRLASPHKRKSHHDNHDMKKTVARLTARTRELELELAERQAHIEAQGQLHVEDELTNEIQELRIANKSLQAELDESSKKLTNQQQKFLDLKKAYQKDMKMKNENEASYNSKGKHQQISNISQNTKPEIEDSYEINLKYIKNVVLKYMCSTNDQSRQLIGVIAHLLHFSSREESIVKECAEWKLPLTK